MTNHKVKCSNFEIANDKPFTLIAGPCQLENEEHALKISSELKKITSDDMPNKIKSGSVIPNVEFKIILGSNANNATPTREILLLKNFLHK